LGLAVFLRQSTSQLIRFGAFVDEVDGFTPEAGLTIAQADMQLSKDGAAFAQKNAAGNAIHDTDGWYSTTLNTIDTDTVGELYLQVYVAGARPVKVRWWVLKEVIYDALFGAGAVAFDVNQRVDVGAWLGTAVTTSATSIKPEVDVNSVSDDATAADNLEATYDGTGYLDAVAPSQQQQLDVIALTGAAINQTVESAVVGVGTPTGVVANTVALDGVYYQVATVANEIDFYFQFDIGADGVPVSVSLHGRLHETPPQDNEIVVYAYNWGGAVWDQVGTIDGVQNSIAADDLTSSFTLFTSHVGTGVNLGKVRVRFADNLLDAAGELFVDQIFTSYAVVNRSVGYALGSIWVDTNASNTNTTSFIDGVADNPVSTWVAALTLSANLNITSFHFAGGSSITLTGNSDAYQFLGDSWVLALGGQSISGAFIHGANVSGLAIGATKPVFENCELNVVTLPGMIARACGIAGIFTCSVAGDYFFDNCYSLIAGIATPVIDFGGVVANTNVNFRDYSGGIEVQNLNTLGSDTMSLEGFGQLIINANCVGGVVAIRGHFTVTDNAGGVVTLSDDARYDLDQVGVAVLDDVLSKSSHNIANSVGRYIRRTGTFFIWEGDAQGPGIGTNQIQLDVGASSEDGAYDPAAVSILDGTGAGQTRLIFQYEGATRIATVDRDWKVNPDATSEFVIFPDSGRGHVNEGLAQGGTASTIILNILASSIDNAYVGQRVFISSGTGADQVGRITAYNGTTKVAVVAQTWGTIPDTTSGYSMLPDAPNLFQGYESAAIWIDTLNGVAGTVTYENGTAENPVDSLADATTLATVLGFSKFMIAPRSSITLTQSYDGFAFGGVGGNGWTLALGGQSISGVTVIGATVSGICTGVVAPSFMDCSIGMVTIPACRLINCAFTNSIICSAAVTYIFDQCYSGVAGTSTPDIDFGAAVLNTNLNFRHYSGGIEILNMGAAGVDKMSLEGDGQLIINENCVGGVVAIRGHFTVTDNAGGVLTLSDDARFAAIELADTILTRQLTESYAVNGVAPTLAQALMLIQQSIGDFGIIGTILTVRNLAGADVASYVLDNATNPTDRARFV
jgi:hypothetical protein